MSEDTVYARKVDEHLDSFAVAPLNELVHEDFCVYFFPHYQLWIFPSHAFWWRYIDLERLAHVETSTHFVAWHNKEMFGLWTIVRVEVFVASPDVWRPLDPYSLLNVPATAVLSYFSKLILSGSATLGKYVCRVARSEQAVNVLKPYLEGCRDGVSKHRSPDLRIHYGLLVAIVALSPAVRQFLHDYGFFQIVRGTSFDSALA